MLTRALALKSMLLLLAGSTIFGIACIFWGSEFSYRLESTVVVITVAVALLIGALPKDNAARMHQLQSTYAGLVVILAALLVWEIWSVGSSRSSGPEDLLWIWTLLGIPAFLTAIPALRNRRESDRACALAESVSILGAYAAVGFAIGTQLVTGFGNWAPEPTEIGWAVLVSTVVAAAAATGLRKPSTNRFSALAPTTPIDRTLAWIGMSAAALGGLAYIALFVMGVAGLRRWFGLGLIPSALCVELFATAAIPAAVWNLLGLVRIASMLRFLRHIAAASTLALGMLSCYLAWLSATEPVATDYTYSRHEFLQQCLLALSILSAASLLAGLVVLRLNRSRPLAVEPIDSLKWTCPRCDSRMIIARGESSCSKCALTVLIDFRDDRCPTCAYDLRAASTHSAHCPECGRARQVPTLVSVSTASATS